MDKLVAAAPSENRVVITVAGLIGRKGGDNPHLWYDLNLGRAMASALCEPLTGARAQKADTFKANTAAFNKGTAVAATEPVFGYMLGAMELNIEEQAFQLAVMDETEPAVSDVARFEGGIKSKAIKVFFHNTQATSPLVEKLASLAKGLEATP